ncbi:hypothetical protein HMPREF0045_00409 [Actinomyces graevenitzii C83]|uniref:Uncharacterized protein n=1 Tax=Actinomyces graevenitzii C83 TaxID=435830 RepID=G9PE16_9ACTO|nr:hypothetical protein HMPREF0045_00409 [Actinomyces graevenitzii C83]
MTHANWYVAAYIAAASGSMGPAGSATAEKPPGLVVVSRLLITMPLSSLSPSVFAIAEGDKAIIGTSTYINLLICTISRFNYDPF